MARPDPPERIYLDSCILIAYLNGEPHPDIPLLVKILLNGKYKAVVSSLHYVEVTKRRTEPFDPDREEAALALIEAPAFNMVDIGPDVQLRARDYILHRGLKPYDAMHVAAAVTAECDVLMTTDSRLQRYEGRNRLIQGVWIDTAYLPQPETGIIRDLA